MRPKKCDYLGKCDYFPQKHLSVYLEGLFIKKYESLVFKLKKIENVRNRVKNYNCFRMRRCDSIISTRKISGNLKTFGHNFGHFQIKKKN